MSVQTDPVPPVPEHTPPLKEDEVARDNGKFFNQTWTRWFVSVRAKINVLSESLVNLGNVAGNGLVAKNADNWFARTLTGTSNRVTVSNGDGASGNPTINVVTSDLVAGSNVSFTGSGTGRIIGSGNLTINATGGGAASTWVPILSWRHSADGDAAEIDSPDLSPYSEVMVIGEAITTSVSAWRVIRFSDDGGSSYDATNNYININTSGAVANTDNALYLHSSANAAARRVFATIPAINTSLPKVIDCPRGPTFYTKATPINRMRIYPTSGVFTGGEIHILAR